MFIPYNLKFTKRFIICGTKKYSRKLIEQIIKACSNPLIKNIVIDGFCGMGGVTAGFSKLSGWKVIVCLNHWFTAIETHKKNHPDCLHLLEDFREADLTIIRYMIAEIQKANPGVKVHLWLSLECTNFSIAKGGQSRDADSRTLADHADRYVKELNPDVIWIENVKEFRLWGPMVPKVCTGIGKKKKNYQFNPDEDDANIFFDKMIADGMQPYCPLAVIDKKKKLRGTWFIPEKKRLSEDYNRWMEYIQSFGYKADDRTFNCADYGIPQHRVRLIIQFNRIGIQSKFPKPTHDKKGKNGLPFWNPVRPCLNLEDEGDSFFGFELVKSGKNKGTLQPRITSTKTVDRLIKGIDKELLPNLSSSTSKERLIDHYFGNGYMNPISRPIGCTGTKDGAALHTVQFMANDFSNGPHHTSIDNPTGAILGIPKQKLVSLGQLPMNKKTGKSKLIKANGKHYFLVNFQWMNASVKSIYKEANCVIARQDKAPTYLFTLETGELAIEIFPHDPKHYVKLKQYMATNGIVGVNMRMLHEIEMLRIMTIPEKTKMSKSSVANKKMIGNAVPSDFVAHLGMAYDAPDELKQVA